MTEQDFAAAIDSEGGIFEALDYGLRPQDAPPGELRDAWTELRVAYLSLRPLVQKVAALLDELEGDDD